MLSLCIYLNTYNLCLFYQVSHSQRWVISEYINVMLKLPAEYFLGWIHEDCKFPFRCLFEFVHDTGLHSHNFYVSRIKILRFLKYSICILHSMLCSLGCFSPLCDSSCLLIPETQSQFIWTDSFITSLCKAKNSSQFF